MNHGKSICNELKAVRRRIAEENDIPLQQEECHYEGECDGTCPRCEAELKYLEDELAHRVRKGNIAKVAGLALGLAACSNPRIPAGKPAVIPEPDGRLMGEPAVLIETIEVKGQLVDGHVPLPFVRVIFRQGDRAVDTVETDLDGHFSAKLPLGEYEMEVRSMGYEPKVVPVIARPSNGIGTVKLTLIPKVILPRLMVGIPPVEIINEIGPDAPTQQMEAEGVKVKVQ